MQESNLNSLKNWYPPKNWTKITSIDAHTEGEPLRIFTSGLPELKGNTILEKRNYFKNNFDHIRTATMWEPRGHADMYGCILIQPEREDSDVGVIFTHNEGYSSMCGHGIIALTTVLIETGIVPALEPVTTIKIDAPAGQIISHAKINNNRVENVFFQNVPSFLYLKDKEILVEGIGNIEFDIGYGGAFYAYVNADKLNINMKAANFNELIQMGMIIKKTIMDNFQFIHPFEEDLSFLYGTIFYGKPCGKTADSRNVCIFAEGEVDRSPTGTGVSGRLAIEYAKGNLALDESMTIESIIGTKFIGKIIRNTNYAEYDAIIPQVEGTAYITGKHEFIIDPLDPLQDGFILR